MTAGRILPALSMLGLGIFLAILSLDGPMVDPAGRYARFFAAIINGMIGQFGTIGSAIIFVGSGLALAALILFGPRNT